MDNKKRNKWLIIIEPLVIFLVFIAAFELGKKVDKYNSSSTLSQEFTNLLYQYSSKNKINEVLEAIKDKYVDSVNIDTLQEKAIQLLLKDLDPHSIYIPPVEAKSENEEMSGNFEGIGIYFNVQNDTVVVAGVIPGTPSEKSGLLPGDKIIMVDDTSIVGMNTMDIMKRIKGPKGSKVKITVIKPVTKDTVSYTIKRDIIPIKSVDVSFKVKDDIGYIKISRFAQNTYDEFVKAVKKLHNQNVHKLILDLRGNPGGYMQIAIKIADEFLPEGKTILYIKGLHQPKTVYYSTSHNLCVNDDVAVLIDEWSASASEIVAGALQDNDRAIIIGRRSFGKGLVQEPMQFSDGSTVRLTIARYYTPTGRCIQRSYNKGVEDYYQEITKRFYDGELISKDSIHFPDSLKYTTPKGKIVYGGGGIMPDIFVPLDTNKYDDFYYEVMGKNLLYKFALTFSNEHRETLKRIKTPQKMYKWLLSNGMWEAFMNFTKTQKLRYTLQSDVTRKVLRDYAAAFIVRLYFGDEGFYPIYLKHDNVFLKAVEYFEKKGKQQRRIKKKAT
jgi:carboxyl-terminal processing protease